MILNIYSVLDIVAKAFGTPFFSPSDALARRSFKDLSTDDRSTVFFNQCDFVLYKLGFFNDVTGEVKSLDNPELICRASDFLDFSTEYFQRVIKSKAKELSGDDNL